MEELAQKLQLSSFARFAGRIAAAGTDTEFVKASIVVVPSPGGDVFGLVLAENMSQGLPVIAGWATQPRPC
jgi:glycosyltransferase involved in cell wall biosynthesis